MWQFTSFQVHNILYYNHLQTQLAKFNYSEQQKTPENWLKTNSNFEAKTVDMPANKKLFVANKKDRHICVNRAIESTKHGKENKNACRHTSKYVLLLILYVHTFSPTSNH